MKDKKVVYIHEFLDKLEGKKRKKKIKKNLCPWWKSHSWTDWRFCDLEVNYDTPYYRENYPHIDPEQIYIEPGRARNCFNCEAVELHGLTRR